MASHTPVSPRLAGVSDGAQKRVWYIAIGSMMNGTALRMRGIYPARSIWCKIQDHSHVFYAPGGMATIWPEKGATANAVAHDITEEELETLESREPPSIEIYARLYPGAVQSEMIRGFSSVTRSIFLDGIRWKDDFVVGENNDSEFVVQESSMASGQIVAATSAGLTVQVYSPDDFVAGQPVSISGTFAGVPTSIQPTRPVPGKPSERYLQIMVEGARDAGMASSELAELAATPSIPRKTLQAMKKLTVNNDATRLFFSEEVSQSNQFVTIRGMVFEGPPKKDNTTFPPGTIDLAIWFATQMYDPLYGQPPDDTSKPWAGWAFIEDLVSEYFENSGYKHVGWIKGSEASSAPQDARFQSAKL